jgi:hypothetical protein
MVHNIIWPSKISYLIILISVLITYQNAYAYDPSLAFSDLISGPDTGLGDGSGSGVIVTVWGQHLGSSQGDSTISFTDSEGNTFNNPHVYYWKNADGKTPSGPANLFESHKMQEIAFSIPDSASGPGTIKVTIDGIDSNKLPFTVRSGNIYHVTSSGSDAGDGSWSKPWLTVDHADDTAPAGSTIYIQDVHSGSKSSARAIYWNKSSSSSSLAAQFAIIAYPGFHPSFTAQRTVETYKTDALVVSKLDLYASNYVAVTSTDQPTGSTIDGGATYAIETNANGRAVANRIGDIPGGCASKTHGAIYGNADFYDKVSNYKIFGNEVYDYGCYGSYKLHHTTYMTIRSAPENLQVVPWEFGYNYLHGNRAKFGIHQFDQDEGCGDFTGPLRIHDNVIIDQASAGISIGSQCGWSMDAYIENNVLINVGLAADWNGVDPDTAATPELGGINIRDSGLSGTMYIRNNLVYKWSADGSTQTNRSCLSFYGSQSQVSVEFNNNICYTELDLPFLAATTNAVLSKVSGSSNVWYYSKSSPVNAIAPSWDTKQIDTNPLINITGTNISLSKDSPVIGAAEAVPLMKDVYGISRSKVIGPVELYKLPNPPTGVQINSN